MVGNLLYGADRAEIPAEESPQDQSEKKYYGEPDDASNKRSSQSLYITQNKLLELVGCYW
jgi:hypothetical protein